MSAARPMEPMEPVSADAALLDAVAVAARQAGAAIRQVRAELIAQGGLAHERKGDGSPVTRADLAANAVLLAALERLTPGVPIVSEESADRWPDHVPGQYWLVDPLDGTREFIAGRGEYTVNLALIQAGQPVLGVVHVPAEGATYAGRAGAGAWREGAGGRRDIRVSGRAVPRIALASRSHRDAATDALLARLGPVQSMACGSSVKFCRLAEGAADVYPRLGPTCEWDTAAGDAVLRAAGGCVVGPDGQPLRYGKPGWRNTPFVAWGFAPAPQNLLG